MVGRAIKSPWHLNSAGTKLSRGALQPRPNSREISVMRLLIGDDACKDRAVEWVSPAGSYIGFAIANVGRIRRVGPDVVDAPEGTYDGHAHIVFATARPADEPLDAVVAERHNLIVDAVRALFTLVHDPAPSAAGWSGPPLATLG